MSRSYPFIRPMIVCLALISLISVPPSAAAPAATVDIAIQGFAFRPQSRTVLAGTTVRWTNMDSAPHTATADNSAWSTLTLNGGESGEITFAVPGSNPYHCAIHPSMTGTILVTEVASTQYLPLIEH